MKTVFILGAGASVAAGAPLMGNFLHTARKLYEKGAYGQDSHVIKDVLDAATVDIKSMLAKASFDYKNIEELFSAVDIGCLIGRYGARSPDKIDELRKSIIKFIYRTIEETIEVPCRSGKIYVPKGYDTLMAEVRDLIIAGARLGKKPISFISFNYDTALEFALVRNQLGVDYGLPEYFVDPQEQQFQVTVPVYKLHGSINWGSCEACGNIVPTQIDQWRRHSAVHLDGPAFNLKFDHGSAVSRNLHPRCGKPLGELPFIVPPTWNKSNATSADLKTVWRKAADELSEATNIVVIGYSFPASDMFFKYLFALGSHSDALLEKFVVINGPSTPNDSNYQATLARFRKMLGHMSQDGFDPHEFLFTGAGAVIRKVLND